MLSILGLILLASFAQAANVCPNAVAHSPNVFRTYDYATQGSHIDRGSYLGIIPPMVDIGITIEGRNDVPYEIHIYAREPDSSIICPIYDFPDLIGRPILTPSSQDTLIFRFQKPYEVWLKVWNYCYDCTNPIGFQNFQILYTISGQNVVPSDTITRGERKNIWLSPSSSMKFNINDEGIGDYCLSVKAMNEGSFKVMINGANESPEVGELLRCFEDSGAIEASIMGVSGSPWVEVSAELIENSNGNLSPSSSVESGNGAITAGIAGALGGLLIGSLSVFWYQRRQIDRVAFLFLNGDLTPEGYRARGGTLNPRGTISSILAFFRGAPESRRGDVSSVSTGVPPQFPRYGSTRVSRSARASRSVA